MFMKLYLTELLVFILTVVAAQFTPRFNPYKVYKLREPVALLGLVFVIDLLAIIATFFFHILS